MAYLPCRNLVIQITLLFNVLWLSHGLIFRYGPTDTTMAVGKTAVLQCAVTIQTSTETVTWVHVETEQVLSKDSEILSVDKRYSIIGNRENRGEYYLTIRDVQGSDEGDYKCMSGTEYRSANLNVIVPPPKEFPECDVAPAPAINRPGELTQLSCASDGGDPPARLTWKRHGIIISPTVTLSNQLQRVIYEVDNGVPYTCFAASPALDKPRSCTVMVLNIPPTAEIKPKEQEVRAGETATFECTGSGMPKVTSYQWLVNYATVIPGKMSRYSMDPTNRTLSISNVRRWEHGSLFICEVAIASGLKGRASARLDVHTPPVTVAKQAKDAGHVQPTVHPNLRLDQNVAPPKGRIHIADHAGALIGSIIGTLLLLSIVLVLTCLVLKAKMKQMGIDVMPAALPGVFCTKVKKSSDDEDSFPIYAKPNKIRNDAPPLPDAPRPDRNTLTRSTHTLPRTMARSDDEFAQVPKRKLKKHFSNYERIDLVPRRVSFIENMVIKEGEPLSTIPTPSNDIIYADLEIEKSGVPGPDVVISNRPDAVPYAQLRI